ncbi:MAG: AraC family transcriptional regulator [Ferrovibrio sp.]|uniref:AraC family transcriptional regulator n=1 Tax=Ferrovibrio sp. TaxID=1917215 RepID=UPI00262C25C3|nr:AraC family transcriptional regulator [Ferrovibrio sp.]MCW0234117.1 AraC family transcriptional regulator [Ferrovibrio sp.]
MGAETNTPNTSPPTTSPRSVAAGYVRTLLDAVQDGAAAARRLAAGPVTAAAVLAEAGLPAGLLEGEVARLPHDTVSAIWLAALRLTGDAQLGLHVGEQVRPGSFDALGQLLMTCATLGEAAEQADRFAALVGGGGRFAARTEATGIRLLYLPFDPDWPCRRQRVEAVLAATLTFTRWLCGNAVQPHSVSFGHAAPGTIGEHCRIFGVVPQFDADEDSILLGSAVLGLPVRQANPALKAVLSGFVQAELARLNNDDPLRGRLADSLRAALGAGETPGIEAAAAALALTPRTLQRRLAERDTSFQAEVNTLRCALAKDLLRDPAQGIAAIAARLGFADVANFHRAFKSWTGVTPTQWRDMP